ncbi:hypothetical protein WBG99_18110 [Streptomyces sp. TG1A-60]|uniref:hypothetical protein n=1 Tax=Streptomyces sp. TG1A-60 TaxID=3129111 RepID=UPI0030D3CC2F
MGAAEVDTLYTVEQFLYGVQRHAVAYGKGGGPEFNLTPGHRPAPRPTVSRHSPADRQLSLAGCVRS